jgi:predicted ribosome quality control (RQC) complex YloA/Tae2 family protein
MRLILQAKLLTARLPYKTKEYDGWSILIGRSAMDNDTLSMEVAQPNDFWMHVADVPGSHIVIQNPDGLDELPREVMIEAARTAVENSKARGQSRVPVVVGRAGDLSKPRGADVGEVHISNFRTIKV